MKTATELQTELDELKTHMAEQATLSEKMYSQVNQLLLWKSALKVKVNESCPHVDIIGKEGYVSDLFPDGFTVWHIKEDGTFDFWRLTASWLDIVEWDKEQFDKNMAGMNCVQVGGVWTCKS